MSLLLEECAHCYFGLLDYHPTPSKDSDEWRDNVDGVREPYFQIRNDPLKAAVRHAHLDVVKLLLSTVYQEVTAEPRLMER